MADKDELFGNTEQLEVSHEKDHFADPGKMVGDLISRAGAIETVRKAKSIGQAHRMLIQLPNVDAVPVRHGRWKEDTGGYGFWICSTCGFVSEASAADMLYKFCPVCGAKMDGKDGEQHG